MLDFGGRIFGCHILNGLKHVDSEDKQNCQNDSFDSNRGMTIINESGLYSLVLSSKPLFSKSIKSHKKGGERANPTGLTSVDATGAQSPLIKRPWTMKARHKVPRLSLSHQTLLRPSPPIHVYHSKGTVSINSLL